jgi:membrane-associated phospholipid phosphatase
MGDLHFNQDLIRFLAEHRSGALTAFFQFFSFMGEIEGYLMVFALVFVAYDKRLALQAGVVVLAAMTANHLLKIVIQNPRPFVLDGDYAHYWAVSARNAAELSAEYSTPSGHAMAGAAFYGFLLLRIQNIWIRFALVVTIILLGVSRPIVGVHYAEDIALGWVLGATIALAAHLWLDCGLKTWDRFQSACRILLVLAFSGLVWIATVQALGRPLAEMPTAFVAYLGFLSGVLLAIPIEHHRLDFNPKGASPFVIAARFVVMAALLVGALALLDWLFAFAAEEASPLGFLLRFLRYAIVGGLGVIATPWLFARLRLARTTQAQTAQSL